MLHFAKKIIKTVTGVFLVLMTQQMTQNPAGASSSQSSSRDDHGIILFYTDGVPGEDLAGLNDPNLYGGELIVFWSDIEPEDGVYDWSRFDQDLAAWGARGKKLDIRLSTVHNKPNNTPAWVYENYQVRRVARGAWNGFEKDLDGYRLLGAAMRQKGVSPKPHSEWEVYAASSQPGTVPFLEYGTERALDSGSTYSIQFDYRIDKPGNFEIHVKSASLKEEKVFEFSGDQGVWSSASVEVDLGDATDYQVEWVIRDGGAISVDNASVLKIQLGRDRRVSDYEEGLGDWTLNEEIARLTSDPEIVYEGKTSVLVNNDQDLYRQILINDKDKFELQKGRGYVFFIFFRALEDTTLRMKLFRESDPANVIDERVLKVKAEDHGRDAYWYPMTLEEDDIRFEVGIEGKGSVVLDNISREAWSDRVTCFPDYFDPNFQKVWERFVQAFAERYNGHPALGTISVGGFGRWEEVMLDEDLHGVLDEQWKSRGWSEENYLNLVAHWMDVYKDAFDKQDLRICLAYGLQHSNDQLWVYYRTAQEAVKRGIGLKQNGFGEKYDTWDENTCGSYLFNRYADVVPTTHETGGQMYNNMLNAMGHPVNLLNRAMMNQTDYLFLYAPDIVGRHMKKYFHYYTEAMPSAQFTRMYSWLGDQSMVNEHSPIPVDYKNFWIGLRQYQAPGANMTFTDIDGEKVGVTSPGNPRIYFDVDDRAQYHGMYGATLSVDYLDQGTGSFAVQVYDNSRGQYQTLGTVKKTNTGEFKRVSFYETNWNRSSRNSGEDVHRDIILDDLGTEPLTVCNVELSFVPARFWEMELVQEKAPTKAYFHLGAVLSTNIEVKGSYPISQVSLPIWSGSLERSNLVARVYALDHFGRETLLGEKEYFMPADGDWLDLPFAPRMGVKQYRIEMANPTGTVGWYKATDGSPAMRLYCFSPDMKKWDVPGNETVIKTKEKLAREFNSDQPFFGISVPMKRAKADGPSSVNVRLYKDLGDGVFSALVADISELPLGINQQVPLTFEPQTEGRYRLEVDVDWGEVSIARTANDEIDLHPLLLKQSRPSKPAQPGVIGEELLAWEGNALPDGWSAGDAIHVDGDELVIRGTNSWIESPEGLGLETSVDQYIGLHLKNQTSSGMVRIYWAGKGQEFTAYSSVMFPVIPNDDQVREYYFPIGLEEHWKGSVDRLMIKPVVGGVDHGRLELEKVVLSELNTLMKLDFELPSETLYAIHDVESEQGDGFVKATVAGDQPELRVPYNVFNFEGAQDHVLTISIKNESAATKAGFRWFSLDDPNFNTRKGFLIKDSGATLEFEISSHDTEFKTYQIPIGKEIGWKGHLVGLAVNPAVDGKKGDTVLIGSLKLSGEPSKISQEVAR